MNDHEEDRNGPLVTAKQREVTKIAFRPTKRQRMLTSKKADNLSGHEERLYKGEDLKRGSR